MISQQGPVAYMIKDIEGCYPAMPKEAIRMAMRDHILRITSTSGQRGVSVPRFSDTQRCDWRKRPPSDRRHVWLPFSVMLDVLEFALDHAYVQRPDGSLWRQSHGIPMGDPLSPAMAVITCAWMENEWLQTLTDGDKAMFAGRRFMDDILLVYSQANGWDHERFARDFIRSECYWPPLTLEDAKEATFLETTFELTRDGRLAYWLKNDNTDGRKIWRYQHYRSHAPFAQKKALVIASLRKVHKMASDKRRLYESAIAKLREFIALSYPLSLLKAVCNLLGFTTGERTWVTIRNDVEYIDIARLREEQRTVQRPVCN